MNNYSAKKTLLASSVCAALTLPGISYGAIEEIIVTANKREQSFSDVGATMSVMTSSKLVEQRISSMDDIAAAVPSLTFARSDSNTPIYTLRGIGFNESSLGVYPAVSVYLDQAPLTFPTLASHSAFDLERIEVLKGPQGTLFGQNSTGGAVNYVAAKPTDEFEAGVTTTYGRFDLVEVEGFVSGPLTDTLKGRLAIQTHNMDAWQKSITRDDENGEVDFYTGRAIFDWQPNDKTDVTVTLSGWKDESEPQALQLAGTKYAFADQLATPRGLPLLNAPVSPEEPRAADWFAAEPPFSDREMWHHTLRVGYNLADDLLFTSLSSYIDFEQSQGVSRSGSAAQNEDLTDMDASIKTFSQEFRVENTNVETYRWVVGVNYEDSEVEEDQQFSYLNNTSALANGGIFQSSVYLNSNMENFAIFGNFEYNVTEDLNLKLGARYTDSQYEFDSCNYDSGDGSIAGLFNFLGGLLGGGTPFTPIGVGSGQCFTLNYDNVPGYVFNDTLEEDNVSWRVGLDYNINDDILLYANVSKGYKQGSFPTSSPASWTGLEPVTQESVLAYEIGSKSQLMDGRLNLNAAVFKYEYKDKQVRGTIQDDVFVTLPQLRNIPESEVVGAEIELIANPIDGLTLTLSAVYLDTEITESLPDEINVVGIVSDFEGADLPFTSQWSTRFDAEYRWDMDSVSPFVGLTYSYQTEQTAAIDGEETVPVAPPANLPQNKFIPGYEAPFVIDDYGVLDMRAGISALDDSWTLFIWGKNVTDEYYWNNVTIAQDTISRAAAKPVTYGATFSYRF